MSAKNSKSHIYDPVHEAEVLAVLQSMEQDASYNTETRYAADSVKYPTHRITFSERHMEHLKKFPNIDPDQYVANLKMMTRERR